MLEWTSRGRGPRDSRPGTQWSERNLPLGMGGSGDVVGEVR